MTAGSENSKSSSGTLELTQKSAPLVNCVFGLMVGVGLALFCTVSLPLVGGPLTQLFSSMADLFGWTKSAQSLRSPDAAHEATEILAVLLSLGFVITTAILFFKSVSCAGSDADLDDDEPDVEIDTEDYIKVSYWIAGVALFGALWLLLYFIQVFYYDLPRALYDSSLYTLRFAAWVFDSAAIKVAADPSEGFADSMRIIIFWCAILFLIRPAIGRPTRKSDRGPGVSRPVAGEE